MEFVKCVAIDITNDQIVEEFEAFNIILERTPDLDSRIALTQVHVYFYIEDDDGN